MIRPSKTTLKNMELVKEAMQLLAFNGVSPRRFVNWLANNEHFQESFDIWVVSEQNSEREIQNATMELQQALSDLSNRYQSSAYMQKVFRDDNFSSDVLQLITSLRLNSHQPQGQYDHPEFKNYFGHYEPEQEEVGGHPEQFASNQEIPEEKNQFQTRQRSGLPQIPPKQSSSSYQALDTSKIDALDPQTSVPQNYQFSQQPAQSQLMQLPPAQTNSGSFSSPTRESIQNPYIRDCVFSGEKVKKLNEIKSHIIDFINNGINPDDVIESYHRTLRGKIDESLFRAIGDWLGRQKTNLTNLFAGRGYQGGETSQELWDQKRDEPIIKGVQEKLAAYENILKKYGVIPTEEFANFATAFKQHMKFGQQKRQQVAKEIQQQATSPAKPAVDPMAAKMAAAAQPKVDPMAAKMAAAAHKPTATAPAPAATAPAPAATAPAPAATAPAPAATAPAPAATAPAATSGSPYQSALAQKAAQDAAARQKEDERLSFVTHRDWTENQAFLNSIFGRMKDPKKTWLN